MAEQSTVLFENPRALQEIEAFENFFGKSFDEESDEVLARLNFYKNKKRSAVIAYLGPAGAGKSSVLKSLTTKMMVDSLVFDFDVWAYSNRKDIWEAFLLRFLSKLEEEKNKSWLGRLGIRANYVRIIDGGGWLDAWWVVLLVVGVYLFLSYLFWQFLNDGGFFEAFLKYSAPLLIALLVLLGTQELLNKKPVVRTREFAKLLDRELKRVKKPVVIFIEDVDRSGEDGVIFMQSLNSFLKKYSDRTTSSPVIVMAPQVQSFKLVRDSQFDQQGSDMLFDDAIKVYDDALYFMTPAKAIKSEDFYRALGVKDKNLEGVLTKATNIFFEEYGQVTSIRKLKWVLRELEFNVEAYPDLDPGLIFPLVFAKYHKVGDARNALEQVFMGDSVAGHVALAGIFKALTLVDGYEVNWKDLGSLSSYSLGFGVEIGTKVMTEYNRIRLQIVLDQKYGPMVDRLRA